MPDGWPLNDAGKNMEAVDAVERLRILVVEDEHLFADLLVRWLSQKQNLAVAGVAHSGAEAIAMCGESKPQLAFVDIELPDANGLEVAGKLMAVSPAPRIVILSSRCDPYCVYTATRLGVHAYVDKSSPLSELDEVVGEVARGGRVYSPAFLRVKEEFLADPESFHKILSPREISVLLLVVEGVSDEEIARRLGISPSTVNTHRRNLRVKTGAHKDRDLVNYARQWGLVRSRTWWRSGT